MIKKHICKFADKYGHFEVTIRGNPYSKMTYYVCRNCGEEWERGTGAFYGYPPFGAPKKAVIS